MSIEADGNINLTLYNTGEINLAELTKTGSGILSLSKKNVNDSTSLVINVASSNIDINKNNVINVYPSVNLQFTGS